MKTQIAHLINGSSNLVMSYRDMDAVKYLNAKKGTNGDFAGTNAKEREAVASLVKSENPETLHVLVKGVELTLTASRAISSRDLLYYSSEITLEQWMQIMHCQKSPYQHETSFDFVVNGDMTAMTRVSARKNERCAWKERGTTFIDESFVTILD